VKAAFHADDVSPRTFLIGLLIVAAVGAALRLTFPLADPPWRATAGIVWHDEGAWVHNARNKALFGTWRLDDWNPMYVAPVFTGLEYLSFTSFGVGLWQARLVSEIGGLLSVLALAFAIVEAGGRRAGLIAGVLLATNYVYVMWNRAALLETTMVLWMVVSLWAFVRARRRPAWGVVAGLAAWLAFFSKAAAAFFVPALALAALWPWIVAAVGRAAPQDANGDRRLERQATIATLGGLAAGAALGLLLFVTPNWHEYWFYNWQMSVTRKPSYTPQAIVDRLSWFPILHDSFTRMWAVLVVSAVTLAGAFLRWRVLPAVDRLLVTWIVLGVAELLAHDVGNERRFVFLAPAFCGLTALALARDRALVPPSMATLTARRALIAAPVLGYLAYTIVGPLARLPFLYEVRPAVRLSAVLAVALVALMYVFWGRFTRLVRVTIPSGATLWIVGLIVAGDLAQFVQWSAGRTYRNYAALRLVGERLPPGTLVHGKLANGLSLESRIRPVFVGRGFGNYDDRLTRDDIEYVLTYISPEVGYEGPVILDVLSAYPERRVLWTTPVAETTCSCDAVALIAKHAAPATAARPVLSLEEAR
jgi:4-amino-4-deoxy-L-arabinose transferase-like glycosyltransferase